jgi:PAS domain S-box-containing protein
MTVEEGVGAPTTPAGIRGRWTRALLDVVPDAIVVVDGTGVILLANRLAEELFGYRDGELIGREVEVLVPDSARGMHRQLRQARVGQREHRPMGHVASLIGRRRDGSTFPADVSLSWLETDDGAVVAATVRDLTQRLAEQASRDRLEADRARERLEAQLQRSQRLESLGQLAGGVAHEFNNLLAVITNYASFVSDAVDEEATRAGGSWNTVRHDVEQIQLAARRATTLTHQLLAFGHQGKAVEARDLDVNGLIGDLERLLRRTLGEHVELTTQLASPLPRVAIEAGKLEQALVNVAVNARDAMPAGGRLRIETSTELVDEEFARSHVGLQPGSYVKIRVDDAGVGMTPDVRRHAFEPFFSTKPRGEGAGLGLATVYGIVAQVGGWATIYSEPGMGTTVTLLLPAAGGEPVTELPTAAPSAVPAGETVLLVEDEEALRVVAERILSRRATPCSSRRRARKRWCSRRPMTGRSTCCSPT